jgi:hypothetical protein
MNQTMQTSSVPYSMPHHQQAWEFVLSQLRTETSRADYDAWIKPLFPISYKDRVFTVGTYNSYGRDWVESRLASSITRLLSGAFNERLTVKVVLVNSFLTGAGVVAPEAAVEQPPAHEAISPALPDPAPSVPYPSAPTETPAPAKRERKKEDSPRKLILERAYGSERAALIQPERTMYLTHYFFLKWLPLLGHSAATVVMAARSYCYWNPANNETRNVFETDMAQLAQRASVSVRTVKDVLASELVRKYFIRYTVRRHMTPNGVRTAGITLAVRMDDPLTPEDQAAHNLKEDEHWYPPAFDDETDEE